MWPDRSANNRFREMLGGRASPSSWHRGVSGLHARIAGARSMDGPAWDYRWAIPRVAGRVRLFLASFVPHFVVTDDDIEELIDVLNQAQYLGGYDGLLRRADRSSLVKRASRLGAQ